MVRPEVVRRKLSHLHGYLQELERHRAITYEQYLALGGPRREVERLLQLLVEAAVDINVHLVTELGGAPPGDYHSSFLDAARQGVLPAELASRLAPAAGLRNVLVHEYGDIDDAQVHGSIPRALDGWAEYARALESWLTSYEAQERDERA